MFPDTFAGVIHQKVGVHTADKHGKSLRTVEMNAHENSDLFSIVEEHCIESRASRFSINYFVPSQF